MIAALWSRQTFTSLTGLALICLGTASAPTCAALPLSPAERVALPEGKAGTGALAPARMAQEDWARARSLVADDPTWKAWLDQEQARLNHWMAQTRDQIDWVAGWPHDHIDPGTGTFRPWSPDTPPPPASSGPKVFAAWVDINRRHHIDEIRAAARMSQLTRETRWAQWATAQIDLLAQIHKAQPLQKRQGLSVILGTTLEEASAMPALVDAIRLLRTTATPEQIARWDADLISPMVANLIASTTSLNNISVWQASAVGMAGLEFQRSAWLRFATDGPHGLATQLQEGTSSDYFWLELSLGYQNVVCQALHEFLLAAALRGALDEHQLLAWRAHNLLVSPATVRFTDEDAPTINDTNPLPKTPDHAVWGQVWRVLPTHVGLSWAATHPSWDTLVDDPGKDTADRMANGALPVVRSTAVPGLKSLQLRAGGWQAILRVGQDAPTHVHQDTLTTEVKYQGWWLLRNAGVPAYGSALHRQYYKLAPSHNTPLVDGQGVSNWFATPTDMLVDTDRVSARMNTFSKRVAVWRELRVQDGELHDTLAFTAPDATPHAYGTLYHTGCAVSLGKGEALPTALGVDTPGFQYLQAQTSQLVQEQPAVVLNCDRMRFALNLESNQPLQITLATSPQVVAPRQRQTLFISTASPVPSARIDIHFRPLTNEP